MRRYTTGDLLDVLTCGLPKHNREKRLFLMLAAYVDDSGSEGSGPVFVLAGYVSDTNRWKRFSDQWQMALDIPPRLEIVKIQHAFRPEEGWARLNKTQIDERLKRFASIIHKHVDFGVVVFSSWDDIRRVKRDLFGSERVKFPWYNMLFHGVMATVVAHLQVHKIKDKVDFIFDEQGILGKIANAQFDEIFKTLPVEMQQSIGGRPIHRSDKEILPLQAAHTIAWLTRRYAANNNLKVDLSGWDVEHPSLKKLREVPMLFSRFPYERTAPWLWQAIRDRLIREGRMKPNVIGLQNDTNTKGQTPQ